MEQELDRARAILGDRFIVERVIGRGGMGFVVAAIERRTGKNFAVKILHETFRTDSKRLSIEARVAKSIAHPAVIKIFEVDETAGFAVMELIDGPSLGEYLAKHGKLDRSAFSALARAILGALAAAHKNGILHRDVKPSNVLLPENGAVKLGDFGVARVEGASGNTTSGLMLGTPAYAAPEQLRGAADKRSDVYSAGATLFEAATGLRLHSPDHWIEDRKKALLDAGIDEPIAAAISRALEERPEQRFDDAQQFLDAFGSPAKKAPFKPRRGIAIAILIAALTATAFLLLRPTTDPAPPSNLDRGLAALEEGRLIDAQTALVQALEQEPNSAQIHYALALLRWWSNRDKREIALHIDRALELGAQGSQRKFLEGLRLLEDGRNRDAEQHFKTAVEDDPKHRDLRYGLFEALFHSGKAEEAIAEYRRLLEDHPRLKLGGFHVLTWAVLKDDEPLFRWAEQRLAIDRATWSIRWLLAERSWAAALKAIDRAAGGPSDRTELLQLRVAIHALSGDLNEAEKPLKMGSERPIEDRIAEHGLASLGAGDREKALQRLLDALRAQTSGGDPIDAWTRAALIEASHGRRDTFDELIAEAERRAPSDPRVKVSAFLGRRLFGEHAPLAADDHPEHAAAGKGDWRAAAEASTDGRFTIAYAFLRAADHRAAGDRAAMREACDQVLFPRIFNWSWAAFAPHCKVWLAER